MVLKLAIILSILFTFFIKGMIDSSINHFETDFNTIIETKTRQQAWRNLGMIEHSVRADIKDYRKNNSSKKITRDFIFKSINDNGQSTVGGLTGNIFVYDLEYQHLFYNNSSKLDINKVDWNYFLTLKTDNPPEDRITWTYNNNTEWLVCKSLPSTTLGFNNKVSAKTKAFQIKLCQRIIKNDVIKQFNPLFEELYIKREILMSLLHIIFGVFLLSVIIEFSLKKYWQQTSRNRRHSDRKDKCDSCDKSKDCSIYTNLTNE